MDKQDKEKLMDIFRDKKEFCLNQARDYALESVVGKPGDADKHKESSKTYYDRAKIWEEAISIVTNYGIALGNRK